MRFLSTVPFFLAMAVPGEAQQWRLEAAAGFAYKADRRVRAYAGSEWTGAAMARQRPCGGRTRVSVLSHPAFWAMTRSDRKP